MMPFVAGVIGGLVGLVVGSKWLSQGAAFIARRLGVSPFIVSFFLVAISTSIPELAVGVGAALNGEPALSLGDAFGSNIFDLTVIAGLVVLFGRKAVHLPLEVSKRRGLIVLAAACAPLPLLWDGSLSRLDGVVLLGAYALYAGILLYERKALMAAAEDVMPEEESALAQVLQSDAERRRRVMLFSAQIAAGALLLWIGSHYVVWGALGIATALGVPKFIVGLFVVAVGTSLPELAIGVRAALKGTPDISVGDILGSAAVNTTLILGVVALIHPIVPVLLSPVLIAGFVMAAVLVVFLFLANRGGALFPRDGIALVALYALFVLAQLALVRAH